LIRARPVPVVLLAAVLAGCAAPAAAPAPAPDSGGARQLRSDAEVDAVAALLRMEDRRELEPEALGSAAAFANPEVRRLAALAAGRIRDPRGGPLLVRLLSDPDTAVAATAAFALGHLGDSAAVPALVPLLTVERMATAPTVVGEAAAALGKVRTARGREAVEGLLRTAPLDAPGAPRAAGQALLAAWKFPRGADNGHVVRWTESTDPELRWRAAYALTRRPDPAAAPVLARLAADADWRVRSFAVRGLSAPLADSSSLGSTGARRLLLAALRDSALAVRVSAARALGTHADPPSVAALAGAAGGMDAHLAIAAAEALGRLGVAAAGAAPTLRTVALDTARIPGLRAAALTALVQSAPAGVSEVAGILSLERDWRARAAAARAWAGIGPVPRPELMGLARDPDPRVVAATLEAATTAEGAPLAELRPLLVESLAAADPVVRANALSGLGRLADPSTLPVVLNAYDLAQRDSLNDAALNALAVLDTLRAQGAPAAAAFFARFKRSGDYLVRQRAEAVFGAAARQAWGAALPVETGLAPEVYRRIVTDWVAPALEGWTPRVRIVTASGAVDLRFFAADAPLTTLNFVSLAERGYFDGQEWPRVVANFVVQGGDPRGDTSGGPGYAIRDEINRHPYGTGTLGMALSGPDTGGSQWFITHSPQPHLDGGYTVFGEVADGMDVVERVQVGDVISRITRLR
jgi:cyclophilin family peptidyl-prolyl cis-trans isomerase/HEAT repeat protein